jgi:predicted RNA-binding Zn ribbon-like protein
LKKPLQSKKEQFVVLRKGQLIGWGNADVKNLIRMANKALVEKIDINSELTFSDAECALAKEWFDIFLDKGITKEVISRLNSRIGHVHFLHVLSHTPNELPHWRRIANGDRIDDPEISIAYMMAHLLASGEFKNLKRCEHETCNKYFIGRVNKTWCSDRCGVHFRVKKMRKRNDKDQI